MQATVAMWFSDIQLPEEPSESPNVTIDGLLDSAFSLSPASTATSLVDLDGDEACIGPIHALKPRQLHHCSWDGEHHTRHTASSSSP